MKLFIKKGSRNTLSWYSSGREVYGKENGWILLIAIQEKSYVISFAPKYSYIKYDYEQKLYQDYHFIPDWEVNGLLWTRYGYKFGW